MADFVLLKTYPTRLEAEIDQQRLKDAGITTIIKADDAGGMYPNLQHSLGVQLLTNPTSAPQAETILQPVTNLNDPQATSHQPNSIEQSN